MGLEICTRCGALEHVYANQGNRHTCLPTEAAADLIESIASDQLLLLRDQYGVSLARDEREALAASIVRETISAIDRAKGR